MIKRIGLLLLLLALSGCTAGPFITDIKPLGDGKILVTKAWVGQRGLLGLLGLATSNGTTEVIDLNQEAASTKSPTPVKKLP